MTTIGILGDTFFNVIETRKERREALKSLLLKYGEKSEIIIAIPCDMIGFNDYHKMAWTLGYKTTLMYNNFKYIVSGDKKAIDQAIVFSKDSSTSQKYIEQLINQGIQFDVIQLTQRKEEFELREFYVYNDSEIVKFSIAKNLQLGFEWHDISKKYWLMDEGEMVIQSFITDRHNGMKLDKDGDSYQILLRSVSGIWYNFTKVASSIIDNAWFEARIYKTLNIRSLFDALVNKLQVISKNPKLYNHGQYVRLEDI